MPYCGLQCRPHNHTVCLLSVCIVRADLELPAPQPPPHNLHTQTQKPRNLNNKKKKFLFKSTSVSVGAVGLLWCTIFACKEKPTRLQTNALQTSITLLMVEPLRVHMGEHSAWVLMDQLIDGSESESTFLAYSFFNAPWRLRGIHPDLLNRCRNLSFPPQVQCSTHDYASIETLWFVSVTVLWGMLSVWRL